MTSIKRLLNFPKIAQNKYDILKYKKTINMTDSRGNTLLMHSTQLHSHENTELLLKLGANTDFVNSEGENALHIAAKTDNKKCAELLIKHDISINHQDKSGRTPYHNAIIYDNLKLIALLRYQQGSKIDLKDNFGNEPIFYSRDRFVDNLIIGCSSVAFLGGIGLILL